jgi:hypothetical protein
MSILNDPPPAPPKSTGPGLINSATSKLPGVGLINSSCGLINAAVPEPAVRGLINSATSKLPDQPV